MPDGTVITTAAAEAQGFTVLAAGSNAEPPKALHRLFPAPMAPVPPRPVVLPIPAAVVADRARATALIAMTAKGAEAEAECRQAIRLGTTPEEYRATVAARSILDSMGARGR